MVYLDYGHDITRWNFYYRETDALVDDYVS